MGQKKYKAEIETPFFFHKYVLVKIKHFFKNVFIMCEPSVNQRCFYPLLQNCIIAFNFASTEEASKFHSILIAKLETKRQRRLGLLHALCSSCLPSLILSIFPHES